jgi:hypothetical protein
MKNDFLSAAVKFLLAPLSGAVVAILAYHVLTGRHGTLGRRDAGNPGGHFQTLSNGVVPRTPEATWTRLRPSENTNLIPIPVRSQVTNSSVSAEIAMPSALPAAGAPPPPGGNPLTGLGTPALSHGLSNTSGASRMSAPSRDGNPSDVMSFAGDEEGSLSGDKVSPKSAGVAASVHRAALFELATANSNLVVLRARVALLEEQVRDMGGELRELERQQFVTKNRQAREAAQTETARAKP